MQWLADPTQVMRLISLYILVVLFSGSAAIAGIDLLQVRPIPDVVGTILAASLGMALHSFGINQATNLITKGGQ